MAERSERIEIPKRALFRAAEVCDLLNVQAYVLRSWEAEFPNLGVAKSNGGSRVYRRSDVEQAARIKHLLLVDGLTLAGARRRLEEEAAPVGAGTPLDELIDQHVRDRLTEVKRGLRAILEIHTAKAGAEGFRALARTASATAHRASSGKRATPRRRTVSRRKRSA